MLRLLPAACLTAASALSVGGCVIAGLASAMGQNWEYQKKVEVPPRYPDLENRTVAVLVEADLGILYEYQNLVPSLVSGISGRLAQEVPGAQVLSPQGIIAWQYATPQWNALPYGQIAEQLQVDRIVYINIYEYRLNPPGNRWLWEGVCAADVGVIERDSYDPDSFVDTYHVSSTFPDIDGVTVESASRAQIETGVLSQFVRNVAWLFYTHLEPKYPDKYRPELDTG